MDWNKIEGKWSEYKGQFLSKWGKLTDDDLKEVSGNRQALVGKLRQRYNMDETEAEKEADEFFKTIH